jgi:hypothetical protein
MAELALQGGTPAVTRPLGKKWPIWDETERAVLSEVLESGKWWRGYDDPTQSGLGSSRRLYSLPGHRMAWRSPMAMSRWRHRGAAGVEAGDESSSRP